MDLKGSAAIVTGGTGGLGRRICWALAKAGANVAVVYLNSKEAAESYAEELTDLGPQAVAVQADVTTQEGIDKLIERVMEEFGRIDVLVNDAAFNRWISFKDLETLTPEVFDYILHYNVTTPYMAIRSVAPIMRRQGRGRIINVASTAAYLPSGSSAAYAVSKAAVVHLTHCMAVSLAPDVLVNCVSPGLMEGTRMTSNLSPEYAAASRTSSLLKRAADKDDVADAVVTFARTDSITGQSLVIDSGKVFH